MSVNEKTPRYKAFVKRLLMLLVGFMLVFSSRLFADILPKEPMTLPMIPVVIALALVSVFGILLCAYALGVVKK